jgi:hypothetical protein
MLKSAALVVGSALALLGAQLLNPPATVAATPTLVPAQMPIPWESLLPAGDAACNNGDLDSVDALAILQYDAGLVRELCWFLRREGVAFDFDVDLHVGDANYDGAITSQDAHIVLGYHAGCIRDDTIPPSIGPPSTCSSR